MTDNELQLLFSLFARQKEIGQVILYGSRAMGTHKPFSDVDITLMGIGLKRSHLTRLMAEIDESTLPYSFDISIFSQLTNPELIEQIEKTGIVLYTREMNAIVAEPWLFFIQADSPILCKINQDSIIISYNWILVFFILSENYPQFKICYYLFCCT